MTDKQMELGLNGTQPAVWSVRRERRIQRAGWWFAQMRQIVDRAMDWSPVGEPRPEQIWLPGSEREVRI